MNMRACIETARNSRNSRNSILSCWNIALFLFRPRPEQPEHPEQANRPRQSGDIPPAPLGKSSPRLGIKLCELFLTRLLPPRLLLPKGSGCGWVGWIGAHPALHAAAVEPDARVRGSGPSAHRAPAARCARQLREGQGCAAWSAARVEARQLIAGEPLLFFWKAKRALRQRLIATPVPTTIVTGVCADVRFLAAQQA